MSTGYQIVDQFATYYITPTIVDWVDVFSRQVYRDIVLESLKYCIEKKGLLVYGYVIMTNHAHIIVRSENGDLSGIIRDFKKYTAGKILATVANEPESRREWMLHRFSWNASTHTRNANYQVWTHENHAVHVYSKDFFANKLKYTHNNPVRAGWVSYPEEYIYSSAKALLQNLPGQIPLIQWGF